MRTDYHNDTSRISNSMLTLLKRSPELYKLRYIDGIVEDVKSDAMIFGSLVHCVILEFETIQDRYVIKPECDRRTKIGKSTYQEFAAKAGGKTIVTMEQMELAISIADSFANHRDMQAVRKNEHLVEHRIDFDWEGFQCRSMIDLVTKDGRYVIDIKTTQDASPDEFAKSVVSYGYHRQAAMYCHAVEQVFGRQPRFIFAAVSTTEPYVIGCYELDDAAIDLGRLEIDGLLAELKQRTEANDWRSEFTKGINTLSLPRWYQ